MNRKNPNEDLTDKIVNLMRTDDSIDAPPDSIKWAKNLFRARVAAPEKSALRKVLAVLQMDLSSDKAAFGERSASTGQARRMLFKAGENMIDLRIKNTEDGFEARGQILGDFAGAVVKIGDFEATVNALGEFTFAAMPGGNYNFALLKGETEIVIENLQIG